MHLVLALLLQAAPQAPQQDLQVVLHHMFDRAHRDGLRLVAGAKWTKNRTDEDIADPDPRKRKTEHRERYRVWGDGTLMLQLKVERDGKAVSESSKPLPLFIDEEFLNRFEYAFEDPALVQCGDRECYRLAFMPKGSLTPPDGELEQVLIAQASGTLLVDSTDYSILRADAHSVRAHTTFMYDVYWFSVNLTQQAVDGVMVTSFIEMSYSYKKLWGGTKTKRRFYEYTDVSVPPSK